MYLTEHMIPTSYLSAKEKEGKAWRSRSRSRCRLQVPGASIPGTAQAESDVAQWAVWTVGAKFIAYILRTSII